MRSNASLRPCSEPEKQQMVQVVNEIMSMFRSMNLHPTIAVNALFTATSTVVCENSETIDDHKAVETFRLNLITVRNLQAMQKKKMQ